MNSNSISVDAQPPSPPPPPPPPVDYSCTLCITFRAQLSSRRAARPRHARAHKLRNFLPQRLVDNKCPVLQGQVRKRIERLVVVAMTLCRRKEKKSNAMLSASRFFVPSLSWQMIGGFPDERDGARHGIGLSRTDPSSNLAAVVDAPDRGADLHNERQRRHVFLSITP
jgi:hypothetical protein